MVRILAVKTTDKIGSDVKVSGWVDTRRDYSNTEGPPFRFTKTQIKHPYKLACPSVALCVGGRMLVCCKLYGLTEEEIKIVED